MASFFEVRLQVDAPPEYVWRALIDFASYGEWNPFIVKIDGEARIGSKIKLHLKLDPKLEAVKFSDEMIVSLKENQHLCYDSHFLSSSLFNSTRWQAIKPTNNGLSSIYHSHQRLTGLSAWPFARIFGDRIAEGSEASCRALKKRAEELYRAAKKG